MDLDLDLSSVSSNSYMFSRSVSSAMKKTHSTYFIGAALRNKIMHAKLLSTVPDIY